MPIHWSSQTPRRYKRNAIICELHRAYAISDNFDEEKSNIRDRFSKSGFPCGFVNNTITNFKYSRFQELIPGNFFDLPETRPTERVTLPFCKRNENLTRIVLKKLSNFVENSVIMFIIGKVNYGLKIFVRMNI